MLTCVLGRYVASIELLNINQSFRSVMTASVDSCAEIKSASVFSDVTNRLQSLKEGAGKRCSECGRVHGDMNLNGT